MRHFSNFCGHSIQLVVILTNFKMHTFENFHNIFADIGAVLQASSNLLSLCYNSVEVPSSTKFLPVGGYFEGLGAEILVGMIDVIWTFACAAISGTFPSGSV